MRAARILSQLVSASLTGISCLISSLARARGNALAPKISKPCGAGARTPNIFAKVPAVKLCNTTVVIITRNTIGTIFSASRKPASSSFRAKSADTAAATIPRGAIQLSKANSRQFSVVPILDTNTLKGRATKMTTSSTNTTPQPNWLIA